MRSTLSWLYSSFLLSFLTPSLFFSIPIFPPAFLPYIPVFRFCSHSLCSYLLSFSFYPHFYRLSFSLSSIPTFRFFSHILLSYISFLSLLFLPSFLPPLPSFPFVFSLSCYSYFRFSLPVTFPSSHFSSISVFFLFPLPSVSSLPSLPLPITPFLSSFLLPFPQYLPFRLSLLPSLHSYFPCIQSYFPPSPSPPRTTLSSFLPSSPTGSQLWPVDAV